MSAPSARFTASPDRLIPSGKALRATRINGEVEANALNDEFARYYGYKEQFGLESVNENYRGNTGYTSLLWAF